MDETPLARPGHLKHATSPGAWLAKRPFALAAMVAGILTLVLAAVTNQTLWSTPDWRVTVPGLAVAVILAGVSLVRQERAWTLWLIGLGAAGAALVLGWFLLVVIVLVATVALMLILNTVM